MSAIQATAAPPLTERRRRAAPVMAASLLGLALLFVMSITAGPRDVPVSASRVLSVFWDHFPILSAIPHTAAGSEATAIIWEIRLPRAVVAVLVGMLLGLAGVALQGLLQNPLADPYTVGVSAGAAVGAATAEALGVAALGMGSASAGLAFAAALASVALVYALARVRGRVSSETFLLAGVVVGTCLWSLIPLLLVLAGRGQDLTRILFYLIGSLQGADWTRALFLLPVALITAMCLRLWSRDLNLVAMGEETAAHLGVEIESFKRRVILLSAFGTAAAVSVAGIVGFVGLAVPHVARRLIGPDHRALAPCAALLGGILLLGADTAVRAVFSEQLPVGVITALVGAPFFAFLLRRRQRTMEG